MDNTLIDRIAPLNYKIFRGNPFKRTYLFPDDYVMPTVVECFAYKDDSSTKELIDEQPKISKVGQRLIHQYDETSRMPVEAYQEILFDGIIKWGGIVRTSKERSLLAQSQEEMVLIIPATDDVPVAIIVQNPALRAGDVRFLNSVLEYWDGEQWNEIPITAGPVINNVFPFTNFPLILQ